ncbi:hypothetical protein IDH30_01255 [Pelagibacterales bacterium SAG-MED15]|jgi:predicted MFS family arabinose efflux permease|nr:hypothetical protein [Pelagibacterales bacterium SAG-MED15]|tara:strand:+ start:1647 stop:1820 length:174 start_codon:yes stop_codon:yes gene_type:complete
MSKSSLVIAIYIIGLVIGALFLNLWSAETSPQKALLGLAWTAIFLIALFYVEKDKNE